MESIWVTPSKQKKSLRPGNLAQAPFLGQQNGGEGPADDFNMRDPRKLYRLLDPTQAMAFEALKADVGRQVQAPRPRALASRPPRGRTTGCRPTSLPSARTPGKDEVRRLHSGGRRGTSAEQATDLGNELEAKRPENRNARPRWTSRR